jgi:hypothetical protein
MRVVQIGFVYCHVGAVVICNAQGRFSFHPVVENAKILSGRVPVEISLATQIRRRNPNIVQLVEGL